MAVLINGIEMPESCSSCRFARGCQAINRRIGTMERNGTRLFPEDCRHSDCPLISVPEPHGRLIDADALHKLFEAQWHYLQVLNWDENPTAEAKQTGVNWCINTLHDEAPTIIPASEEGSNAEVVEFSDGEIGFIREYAKIAGETSIKTAIINAIHIVLDNSIYH